MGAALIFLGLRLVPGTAFAASSGAGETFCDDILAGRGRQSAKWLYPGVPRPECKYHGQSKRDMIPFMALSPLRWTKAPSDERPAGPAFLEHPILSAG